MWDIIYAKLIFSSSDSIIGLGIIILFLRSFIFPPTSFFYLLPLKYLLPLSTTLTTEYATAPRAGLIAPNAGARYRAVLPI